MMCLRREIAPTPVVGYRPTLLVRQNHRQTYSETHSKTHLAPPLAPTETQALSPMPWHPIVVHFPIVLLLLAVTIDVMALFARRGGWHDTAWRLLLGGTLAALLAVLTGDAAAADHRDAAAADLIQTHEDLATICLLLFAVCCFGRLPVALGRDEARRYLPYWVVLSLVGAGLLVYASHLGGELVFHHGVGVQVSSVP